MSVLKNAWDCLVSRTFCSSRTLINWVIYSSSHMLHSCAESHTATALMNMKTLHMATWPFSFYSVLKTCSLTVFHVTLRGRFADSINPVIDTVKPPRG